MNWRKHLHNKTRLSAFPTWRFARLLLLSAMSLGACTGCNWFMIGAFILPDTKKVPPEFPGLADHKAVVMVWAEPETLFDYPHIRFELASYVTDRLKAEVKGVHLVSPKKVEDFVQRNEGILLHPTELGSEFGADMVIYVELLQFQIRDPEAPSLLQGKVQGAVRVYDLSVDPDEESTHELKPVAVTHPETPQFFSPTGPITIRDATYSQFAERVARKFYEHDEKI